MMSLADSAVWSGSSSLMNRSSEKPLHDRSTFEFLSAVKGADNIMDGGVWWLSFQRLKVSSKVAEKMRGASDVSMGELCFT